MRNGDMHSANAPRRRLGRTARRVASFLVVLWLSAASAQAQVVMPAGGTGRNMGGGSIGGRGGTGSSGATGMPGGFPGSDTTLNHTDTAAVKGIVYHTETPDSVLRSRVFLFRHRTAHLWIDQLWNPTLDPTGAQLHDPVDAMDGNYHLGKGALGHQHLPLFFHPDASLAQRLQPDAFEAYAMRVDNIGFYQTLSPYTLLHYGGSLDKDHQLRLLHTQNIMPGWNAAFEYRLLNPEGIYASSGAVNHYLNATTNYFSPDSRLQASAAIVHQSLNIDENGGLLYDSIFTQRQLSNPAGIPMTFSGAGTRQRQLEAMAGATFSIERQSDRVRQRDSLVAVQVDDSTVRIDTLAVSDTIPLRKPRLLNAGAVGIELHAERDKRVFADSTRWEQQWATLFWTNDVYTDHRWRNLLKVTVGIQPRRAMADVEGDTLRLRTWLDPFVRAEVALRRATLALEGETRATLGSQADSRWSASLDLPFDTARHTVFTLHAVSQRKMPDVRLLADAMNRQQTALRSIATQHLAAALKVGTLLDIGASATHMSHHTWYDTARTVHEGSADLWLLQASLTARLALGPVHLDMQQLAQYSTDPAQLPLPLWMSKNSLYADFTLFDGMLRAQVGGDLRFHTPYHAPLYDPLTGLFLQQDDLTVGGYLWADAFVNLQVKRATISLKAGHLNALWETPARYMLLPHYPGAPFGLMWGITWCFFD